jgi:dihydroorotate dehydrogenase (fumarate)
MDLTTSYLGLKLEHPIMPGASPLMVDLDSIKKLEDAGASAIVMHSLFEEQIVAEQIAATEEMDAHAESYSEALSYFPDPEEYRLGPEQYLEHLRKVKESVKVPVIASLNGVSNGGWLRYASLIEEAGADGLELNVYFLATNTDEDGAAAEKRVAVLLTALKETVKIPVAVKLSPFYSSLPNLAKNLDECGADGLVLFNRFYQPDIDVEALEVTPTLDLSTSSELLLRLRWLAILSGRIKASLAVTGGVHSGIDAIKAIMSGAHAVQLVSSLLKNSPSSLKTILSDMTEWMEKHEYESVEQMQGSMSLLRSPNPQAYERANYAQILQGWKGLK